MSLRPEFRRAFMRRFRGPWWYRLLRKWRVLKHPWDARPEISLRSSRLSGIAYFGGHSSEYQPGYAPPFTVTMWVTDEDPPKPIS